MGYRDKGMVPARHIGRHRASALGIRAYLDLKPALTGTLLTTPTEAEVSAGGQTIIITLALGKWVPTASFNAIRQVIINGLSSQRSGATEWNALVRNAITVGSVVRTSDTVVTVTMATGAAENGLYKIASDETVRFTLPTSAVEGGAGKVAGTNNIVVVNGNPAVTAALTGTFLTTPTEAEVVTGGQTIIITLTGGTLVPAGTSSFDLVRQAIINGLTSAQAEAGGWNATVRAVMAVTTVVRTSGTVVTITLPATAGYVITANETITVTIPSAAVQAVDADIVAAPTIVIVNA